MARINMLSKKGTQEQVETLFLLRALSVPIHSSFVHLILGGSSLFPSLFMAFILGEGHHAALLVTRPKAFTTVRGGFHLGPPLVVGASDWCACPLGMEEDQEHVSTVLSQAGTRPPGPTIRTPSNPSARGGVIGPFAGATDNPFLSWAEDLPFPSSFVSRSRAMRPGNSLGPGEVCRAAW